MRLKSLIKKVVYFFIPAKWSDKVYLINRVGLPLMIANFIFQRILRVNSEYKYPIHYTSRILGSAGLVIEEDDQQEVNISIAVSPGCYYQALNGIYIGKGTMIAPNVSIVSTGHDFQDLNKKLELSPIKVGRYCWIGASSVITPGIELGDHTIVGACSVVTNSFPDGYVVLGGVPARVIRKLDKDRF